MLALICDLTERHRAALANPHKPRAEGKRSRFPGLLARFTRREPRRHRKGGER